MRAAALTSYGSRDWGVYLRAKKRTRARGIFFGLSEMNFSGSAKNGLIMGAFLLGLAVFILGIVYLYQINSIVTKGYDIRDAESQIKDLKQENDKLKIKEVELKSMYNIEKSMEDLDLVSSQTVSYLEMEKPVAMK